MKRIDSPLDAALSQYKSDPEDTVGEIILKVASKLCLPIGMVTAVRDHFSARTRQQRVLEVLSIFKSEHDSLEKECGQNRERCKAIEDRLESPKFIEALVTAVEEAAKTADSKRLGRLACVLTNGTDPDIIQPEDDLPGFVRDVALLSELDIKGLNIIVSLVQPQVSVESTYNNYGQDLLKAAARENVERDDFYSLANRLVGFGLALEGPSMTGRSSTNDLRFVASPRGQKIIALLKKRT